MLMHANKMALFTTKQQGHLTSGARSLPLHSFLFPAPSISVSFYLSHLCLGPFLNPAKGSENHRCDKRLQCLQKNLCKCIYYFVNVYLNKNRMSETKQNYDSYDSDEDNQWTGQLNLVFT